MKTKITILVIIGIFLASCGAETGALETEVVTEAPIEIPISEVSMTEEPVVVVTENPIATDPPTEVPTESPLTCVTLLEPINGIVLPATGKVTFSWTPTDGTGSYVLNFIIPSGQTASFETNQTSRDRYMEAFITGGKYQWQVIAKNVDGSDICVSEVFTFEKPAYEQPQKPKDGGNNDGGGSDECTDPAGCEGGPQ